MTTENALPVDVAPEATTTAYDPGPRWLPRFLTIWTGQSLSLLGTAVVQFSLIWWLTQTTGSATVLAIASLVGLLPQVLLGPFAGAVVDRLNRKRVMIGADGIAALASLAIVLLAAAGTLQTWQVLVAMFVRSSMQALHSPAMQASTGMLVPQAQLTRVAGMNQMVQGLSSIGAPIFGALLIARLPIGSIVLLDVISAAIAIVSLLFVNIPQPIVSTATTVRAILTDMRIGLNYAASWPGLLMLFAVAALINAIVTPAVSLMALLVSGHFNGMPEDLALMQIAFGAGVLLGGILLGVWGGFRRRVYTSILGIMMLGISLLVIGLSPANMLWLAVAGNLVTGISVAVINGPVLAILQAAVPPHMQGRVFGLLGSAVLLPAPLVLAITGPVADRTGVPFWFIMAGGATLLAAFMGLRSRAFLNIEAGPPQRD
ncbi:MAG: MFS transporter [Pleurocapsa minor GSE-CHR-MK-17-07R]|jgi:DHA3 family macrolide efflux protein-like MFS transporter|nr:MFS transporter [Pleurocapsa minor GSE-CHR-MK 17-07R]